MNIVINALSARLGGGQTYLKNLLANLPQQPDLNVLIYAPSSLRLPEDRRIRRGATLWPTENPLLRSVWERLVLPRILVREKADLLFCPGGLLTTIAPKDCRTVTMFRNMTPFDERARRAMPFGLQRLRIWMLERLLLASMARADLTIFISDFARSVIEARIHVRGAQTIPHGIAAAFRTHGQTLERPSQLPSSKYLLYVSKFDSYKHQAEVVQGFSRLPRELQQHYTLVLVGDTDHPSVAQIEVQKNRLCEAGKVQILGAVPYAELPAFYHHAEAIVFASSCENCPNILLEGLASGRPVLSSNVMPMPEFGGSGIEYFSPFDPDDIARALHRVLTDPRHARSVAAAALIESLKFDWYESAARTWAALNNLALKNSRTQKLSTYIN
jgi:glycosyltransferase involved in cell wall biosynthesis